MRNRDKFKFEGLLIDRMEGEEEIFGKLMSNKDLRDLAIEHLLGQVYAKIRNAMNGLNKKED